VSQRAWHVHQWHRASRVVVGFYVDDLIITGAKPADVDVFEEQMRRLF
jgi:hypothetical protein